MKTKRERINDMIENPTSPKNLKKYSKYKLENEGYTESQLRGKRITRYITFTIITLLLAFNLTTEFVVVQGDSMNPTFHNEDKFFMKKGIEPRKDEVVIFKQNMENVNGGSKHEMLIKRVVAVEGDTVLEKDGYIYINGEKYNEQYDSNIEDVNQTFILNENEYFVLGDNYLNSADSRYFGVINKKQLHGVLTKDAEELVHTGQSAKTLFPRLLS